jgi:hypothetical protein
MLMRNVQQVCLYFSFLSLWILRCCNMRGAASVVQWPDFLAADPEVPGRIPGATSISE